MLRPLQLLLVLLQGLQEDRVVIRTATEQVFDVTNSSQLGLLWAAAVALAADGVVHPLRMLLLVLLGVVHGAMVCLLCWACCEGHAQQRAGGLGRRGAKGQRGILRSRGCLCGRLARQPRRRWCWWAPLWAALRHNLNTRILTPAPLTAATRAS